jgi:hypothetical protein
LPGIRGARRGNKHALKHGRFTAEAYASRAEVRRIVRNAQAAIALARCLLSAPRQLEVSKRKL